MTISPWPLSAKGQKRGWGGIGEHHSSAGFIKGILRGVRCTKSLRVVVVIQFIIETA